MLSFLRRVRPWPTVSLDRMRRDARLLVIDDGPFDYLTLFRDNGYTIEHWSDVQNLGELGRGVFDVIVLDIHGVGRELSADQGLGVLRQVRRANPAQLIVAFSAKTFDLGDKQFLDLADAVLEKSADYVDFQATIDRLLEKHYSLSYYVERLRDLARRHISDGAKLRAAAELAILTLDVQPLQKYLARITIDLETRQNVEHIADSAIRTLEALRAK